VLAESCGRSRWFIYAHNPRSREQFHRHPEELRHARQLQSEGYATRTSAKGTWRGDERQQTAWGSVTSSPTAARPIFRYRSAKINGERKVVPGLLQNVVRTGDRLDCNQTGIGIRNNRSCDCSAPKPPQFSTFRTEVRTVFDGVPSCRTRDRVSARRQNRTWMKLALNTLARYLRALFEWRKEFPDDSAARCSIFEKIGASVLGTILSVDDSGRTDL